MSILGEYLQQVKAELLSGTPFFVVKASEPYAHDVVELIKQHEGENWTSDDQAWANAAMGEKP